MALTRKKLTILVTILILLAVPLTLFVLQQQQEVRQRASGVDSPTTDTQVTVIEPVADTYVDATQPTINFGTAETLTVLNSPEKIAYIKFNLDTDELRGKRIIFAVLALNLATESREEATISATGNGWNEMNVTYNSQPTTGIGRTINTFKAAFAAGVGRNKEIDVSSAIVGKSGLVGLAITSASSIPFSFNSRDARGNRPKLEVTYEDPSCPSTHDRLKRLPHNLGNVTGEITIPTAQTTYNLWSRIRANNNYGNSYWLQIDDECKGAVGDQANMTEDVWTWVNFKYGVSTDTMTHTFPTSGKHMIKLIGREPGAAVQQVLLVPSACVPTGTGDNCTDGIRVGAGQNRQILGPVHREILSGTTAWQFGKASTANLPLKDINLTDAQYAYTEAESVFVSKNGIDSSGPGDKANPYLTIGRALTRVKNDTSQTKKKIVISGGTYHESLNINITCDPSLLSQPAARCLTIQPVPGEKVWLDGSKEVTGFTPTASNWVVSWPKENLFTTIVKVAGIDTEVPTSELADPRAIDPLYPMSYWPDNIFVNDKPLEQVSSLIQVQPGRFFVEYDRANNYANPKLYIGDNPTGKKVEATVLRNAALIRSISHNVTIQGIGIKKYGPERGMVIVNAGNVIFEDNTFAWSSGMGLSHNSDNFIARNNTFLYNSDTGISGRADNVLVDGNTFRYTNTERHSGWNSAGIKMTGVKTGTWSNNIAEYNYSKGFWVDISSEDVKLIKNTSRYNAEFGMMYEISQTGTIASNLIHHNGWAGLFIYDASNLQIWNNTFVDNGWNIGFMDTSRLNPEASESARGLSYITENNVLKNNIFSSTIVPENRREGLHASHIDANAMGGANTTADRMISASNKNAFYRKYKIQPLSGVVPYVVHWANGEAGTVNDNKFTDFPSYIAKIPQDRNSIFRDNLAENPFFVDETNQNYVLKADSGLQGQGERLPDAIASVLGVSGTVNIGALNVTPPVTPTPTFTITPTPPITNTATPTVTTAPPTLTPTGPPSTTALQFTMKFHGLGTGGDEVNPNSLGNPTPTRTARNLRVELYTATTNTLVTTVNGTVTYDATSGTFKGTLTAPTTITSGGYNLKVKSARYLWKQQLGVQIISEQQNTIPTMSLITGDINNDEIMNIDDYNILISCYGASGTTKPATCTGTNELNADLFDDGNVNLIDLNLWLREISRIT